MSGFFESLGGSALIGGVFGLAGSNVQQNYNEEMMERQNEMNVENYKHRYQWAMEDMQKAGLKDADGHPLSFPLRFHPS